MTRKRVLALARARAGAGIRIEAGHVNGRCTVLASLSRPDGTRRMLLASAPTWARAAEQVTSGFLREVA